MMKNNIKALYAVIGVLVIGVLILSFALLGQERDPNKGEAKEEKKEIVEVVETVSEEVEEVEAEEIGYDLGVSLEEFNDRFNDVATEIGRTDLIIEYDPTLDKEWGYDDQVFRIETGDASLVRGLVDENTQMVKELILSSNNQFVDEEDVLDYITTSVILIGVTNQKLTAEDRAIIYMNDLSPNYVVENSTTKKSIVGDIEYSLSANSQGLTFKAVNKNELE